MKNKIGLGLLLGLLLYLVSTPIVIVAEEDKVTDMYEDNNQSTVDTDGSDSDSENTEETPNPNDENLLGEETIDNSSLVFDLIKLALALILILALIYFGLKFLNKRNRLFNQVKTLENLGGIPVGTSKSVQIIRVGSKLYLIGVGENVQLLEEIEDGNLKEELLNSFKEQSEFKAETLLSIFKPNRDQEANKSSDNKGDFKNLFSNELEKLKQNRRNLMSKHTEKEDKHE